MYLPPPPAADPALPSARAWLRVALAVGVLFVLFLTMLGVLATALAWSAVLMVPSVLLVAGLTWCVRRVCMIYL